MTLISILSPFREKMRAARLSAGRLLSATADILVPPLCLACRAPLASHEALCVACWSNVDFIRPPICDRLGVPMPFGGDGRLVSAAALADPPAYDRARAVARYAGVMRDLVHDFKFNDRQDARRLMARWLADAGRELLGEADLVVPIPLARLRLLSRRFNQSAMLAQEVCRLSGCAFDPLALVRVRSTRRQVGLSRSERRDNVRGAFAVPPRRRDAIEGRKIVVIDDIITTGATADAASRVLKRAGASRVDVLALAIVTDAGHVPV